MTKSIFVAEIILSPFILAAAEFSFLAAHWNIGLRLIPSVIWLALFSQSLISFQWRGLWFLAGVPVTLCAEAVFIVVECSGNRCIGSFP